MSICNTLAAEVAPFDLPLAIAYLLTAPTGDVGAVASEYSTVFAPMLRSQYARLYTLSLARCAAAEPARESKLASSRLPSLYMQAPVSVCKHALSLPANGALGVALAAARSHIGDLVEASTLATVIPGYGGIDSVVCLPCLLPCHTAPRFARSSLTIPLPITPTAQRHTTPRRQRANNALCAAPTTRHVNTQLDAHTTYAMYRSIDIGLFAANEDYKEQTILTLVHSPDQEPFDLALSLTARHGFDSWRVCMVCVNSSRLHARCTHPRFAWTNLRPCSEVPFPCGRILVSHSPGWVPGALLTLPPGTRHVAV